MVQRVLGRTERTPKNVNFASGEVVEPRVVESNGTGSLVVESGTGARVPAAVAVTGGTLFATGSMGATVDIRAKVVPTVGGRVVPANGNEGAAVATGSEVVASGVDVVKARGSTGSVEGGLVAAFDCSCSARPVAGTLDEVTRRVKGPARGSRVTPRRGVSMEAVLGKCVVVTSAG